MAISKKGDLAQPNKNGIIQIKISAPFKPPKKYDSLYKEK
jgi:hypothetical protein